MVIAILVVVIVVLGISLVYVLVTPRAGGPTAAPTVVRMGISPWSSLSSMRKLYPEISDMWDSLETKYNIKWDWIITEEDASTLFYGGSDFAVLGPLETAEMVFNRGFQAYNFGNIVWNEDACVVRGDSPYQKVTDLLGKKLANFGYDSGAYKYAETLWAHEYGIDASEDFEWVVAPPDVCIELLNKGEVEAALVYGGPWAVGLHDYGMRLLYGPYTEEAKRLLGRPAAAIEGMMIRKDLADAHPEVPKAILEAWTNIYNFMAKDPIGIYDAFLGESYGLNPEQAATFRSIYPFEKHMAKPEPLTDAQIAADMQIIQWAYQHGIIENPPSDNIFLKVQM